jgi:hypothetical protein
MHTQKRLHFIDYARSYAIILALFSHAFVATGAWQQLGDYALLLKQFTRMATPMFVFMFGFMVEYIYVRKARQLGLAVVRKRLLIRSFQCYTGYFLIAVCCLVSGYKHWNGLLESLIFFADIRFGNILKVYAIMMLLMPGVIVLRLRYGIPFIFMALVLLTIGLSFTVKLKSFHFGGVNPLINFLIGAGPVKAGPSVVHSFIFLFAGMFMASSLTSNQVRQRADFGVFYAAAFKLLTTFILLGVLLIRESPGDAWWMFADYTYRGNNMAGYYIIGGVTSVLALVGFGFIIGAKPPSALAGFFLPIGTASLVSYTCGNMLLVLFGPAAERINPLIFISLFFCAVILITKYIERFPMYHFFNNLLSFKYL